MPTAKKSAPADKLAFYDKLIGTDPNVERKGVANAYTSLNGHMFSYMPPSGLLALRLPAGERENFLKKYNTTLYQAYGIVQKEYVTVPDALLKNTKELQKHFAISYAYVKSLKPKPTTKKKK